MREFMQLHEILEASECNSKGLNLVESEVSAWFERHIWPAFGVFANRVGGLRSTRTVLESSHDDIIQLIMVHDYIRLLERDSQAAAVVRPGISFSNEQFSDLLVLSQKERSYYLSLTPEVDRVSQLYSLILYFLEKYFQALSNLQVKARSIRWGEEFFKSLGEQPLAEDSREKFIKFYRGPQCDIFADYEQCYLNLVLAYLVVSKALVSGKLELNYQSQMQQFNRSLQSILLYFGFNNINLMVADWYELYLAARKYHFQIIDYDSYFINLTRTKDPDSGYCAGYVAYKACNYNSDEQLKICATVHDMQKKFNCLLLWDHDIHAVVAAGIIPTYLKNKSLKIDVTSYDACVNLSSTLLFLAEMNLNTFLRVTVCIGDHIAHAVGLRMCVVDTRKRLEYYDSQTAVKAWYKDDYDIINCFASYLQNEVFAKRLKSDQSNISHVSMRLMVNISDMTDKMVDPGLGYLERFTHLAHGHRTVESKDDIVREIYIDKDFDTSRIILSILVVCSAELNTPFNPTTTEQNRAALDSLVTQLFLIIAYFYRGRDDKHLERVKQAQAIYMSRPALFYSIAVSLPVGAVYRRYSPELGDQLDSITMMRRVFTV